MAGILAKLQACYGPDRVVDVFKGIGIESKARDLNMGAYVIRNVLPPEQLAIWHQALEDSMMDITNKTGSTRAVDLKGDRPGPARYRTIQCTSGLCTCKYDYAATGRHKLYKTKEIKPFADVCDWVNKIHKVDRKEYFDEIVANLYSRSENQYAGYHTDQSDLLGATSDILSLSMGAAGVFFWRPSPDGPLRSNGEGWAKEVYRHDAEKKAGLWGCVPLLPGDLFLCCGTFQHHLLHGSLKYTEAANVDEVTVNYSTCPEATVRLHSPEYRNYFDQSRMQPDR